MFEFKTYLSKFFVIFILFALTAALSAQTAEYPLGTIEVGVPFSLNFGQGLDQIPATPGFEFSFTFSASGNLPPGITLQSNGLLSGTPTTPGSFSFTLTFGYHFAYMGQSYDFSEPIPVNLIVIGGSGPTVLVDSKGLNFVLTQAGATPATNSISITNRGSAVKSFSASASTNAGGNWLSVTPGGGAVAPFTSTSVLVTANPAGLAPGTYSGKVSIAIAPTGESFDVPVLITVAGSQQSIQLSQSGLRFQAVTGGAAPPSQTINVFNSGSGALDFAASTSTISGGANWLSVSPSSGRATASSSGSLAISVNPAGLAAGNYYGSVDVTAPGAANSPQTVTVVLSVFTPATSPGAQVSPTGLIFVGSAGGTVAAKPLSVSNPSPLPLTFSAAASYSTGNNWLTILPASGSVMDTTTLTVQPNLTGLAPNVYRAEVALRFNEDKSVRRIAILLLVLPPGITPPSGLQFKDVRAATCAPTKLLPLFTRLPSGFSTPVAWPTPIEATIIDDCGTPMVAGSTVASFSSGDSALPLTSLHDGRWTGTWQPRNNVPQVTVTLKAQQIQPPLQGTESIGGALQANPSVPSISAGGAVSAASNLAQQPLAPGSFMTIYGSHLSTGLLQSTKLPLETQLGETQAILAGRKLPMQFASDGQINAIIPFDVPVNTTLQLTVRQGGSVSVPEPVAIAEAQPAVFLTAQGGGIITGVRPDGAFINVGETVTAGDTIIIYCAGLGAVNPPVPAGSAAPLTALSRTANPVSVSIGSRDAAVSFAGLSPGFTGLYQINAVVPAGIAPGNATLIITAAGQQSAPVTLPVK